MTLILLSISNQEKKSKNDRLDNNPYKVLSKDCSRDKEEDSTFMLEEKSTKMK